MESRELLQLLAVHSRDAQTKSAVTFLIHSDANLLSITQMCHHPVLSCIC